MKQFQFEYKNSSNFKREILRIKKYINVVVYSRLVIQIYTRLSDYKEIKLMTDVIDEQLPDALYYGCQTTDTILEGDISENSTIIVCTIYEEFSSNVKIIHIDPKKPGADSSALQNIINFCNFTKWVKAVEIVSTIQAAQYYHFGRDNLKFRDEIQVIGGVASNPTSIEKQDCFVFSKQGGVSASGCIFLIYGGDNLHFYTNYVTGWKGLGKHYTITDCEDNIIHKIDNQPAFDQTYKKYLKMDSTQIYNIMKFPLLVEQDGRESLRTSVKVLKDGSIEMFADVQQGASVRLSYGDPNTILDDIKEILKKVTTFSPEVIRLYPSSTRKLFLRDELVQKEIGSFEEIAPTTGFYTHGEFYRENGFLNQYNCTLVIASMREGEPVNLDYNVDEYFEDDIHTDSLVNHLVNFIGEATQEVENQFTNTLTSLASIYLTLHIINLKENTFETYSSPEYLKKMFKGKNDAVNQLREAISKSAVSEHREKVLAFTDLATVSERLEGKTVISEEYISKQVGWLRCQFIALDYDSNNELESVIITTQIIDDEKKKVAKLKEESTTDGLTGFYNRRGYEEILAKNPEVPPQNNFIYIVMDVNGLKVANDTLGHEAGDELICGAADCIRKCFGLHGSLFRTGGDEFAAIVFVNEKELEKLRKKFDETTSKWTGKYVKELSVSCGFVCKSEYPEATVTELAKEADQRMYKAKSEYYKNKGIDRRGQQKAYSEICSSYEYILKVNLTEDSFKIISSTADNVFDSSVWQISEHIKNMVNSGSVYEEDIKEFSEKTDINYLRDYFLRDKKSLCVFFRRKTGETYRQTMMEFVKTAGYTLEKQKVFLYLKDIDKSE